MTDLSLHVLSLRYSSWSIRPYLALAAGGAKFSVETVELTDMGVQGSKDGPDVAAISEDQLKRRRKQGSVTGLFPVLYVNSHPIHESFAICEWTAETFPEAELWPEDALDRARARSVCCEMVSGFQHLRTKLGCHVFARVPKKNHDDALERDIQRVFEIWRESLDRSGGPFLFGKFSIADCMYFPVLTRFRTYGVELDSLLESYARKMEAHNSVLTWQKAAFAAPPIPLYDDMIRRLGGDPEAGYAKKQQ